MERDVVVRNRRTPRARITASSWRRWSAVIADGDIVEIISPPGEQRHAKSLYCKPTGNGGEFTERNSELPARCGINCRPFCGGQQKTDGQPLTIRMNSDSVMRHTRLNSVRSGGISRSSRNPPHGVGHRFRYGRVFKSSGKPWHSATQSGDDHGAVPRILAAHRPHPRGLSARDTAPASGSPLRRPGGVSPRRRSHCAQRLSLLFRSAGQSGAHTLRATDRRTYRDPEYFPGTVS